MRRFYFVITIVLSLIAPMGSFAISNAEFRCALHFSNNLDLTHYVQFSFSAKSSFVSDLKRFIESNSIKKGDIFVFELNEVDVPIMAQLVSINESTIDVNFPYMSPPFPFNSYRNVSLKKGSISKVGSSFEALKYTFEKIAEDLENNSVTVLTYKDEKGTVRVAAGRVILKAVEQDSIKIRPFGAWAQVDGEAIKNLQTVTIDLRQVVTIYHLDSYILGSGYLRNITDMVRMATSLLSMKQNEGK